MTDITLNEFLPCRKCGEINIAEWDGRGTQAEMRCLTCGQEEGVQICDLLEYEERFGDDPGFQWDNNTISYGDKAVSRAREVLLTEWNMRPDKEAWQAATQSARRAALDEAAKACYTRAYARHSPSVEALNCAQAIRALGKSASVGGSKDWQLKMAKIEAEVSEQSGSSMGAGVLALDPTPPQQEKGDE